MKARLSAKLLLGKLVFIHMQTTLIFALSRRFHSEVHSNSEMAYYMLLGRFEFSPRRQLICLQFPLTGCFMDNVCSCHSH